ncbi:MAG: hypothetical protein V4568_04905 [Pseudomonadota bacterium]
MANNRVRNVLAVMVASVFSLSALAANQVVMLTSYRLKEIPLLNNASGAAPPNYSPSNWLCAAENGANAEILSRIVDATSKRASIEVRVLTGRCAGLSGWVEPENVRSGQ